MKQKRKKDQKFTNRLWRKRNRERERRTYLRNKQLKAGKEDSQSIIWSGVKVVVQVNKENEAKTQKQKWLKKWGSEGKERISILKTEKQWETQGSRG